MFMNKQGWTKIYKKYKFWIFAQNFDLCVQNMQHLSFNSLVKHSNLWSKDKDIIMYNAAQ